MIRYSKIHSFDYSAISRRKLDDITQVDAKLRRDCRVDRLEERADSVKTKFGLRVDGFLKCLHMSG